MSKRVRGIQTKYNKKKILQIKYLRFKQFGMKYNVYTIQLHVIIFTTLILG